jgi:D-alanyl-D-alanine carboxypeptidase
MISFYTFGWTSGAIVTTAENLARWAGLLYGGTVLSPAYLEKMLTFYPRQVPVTTGYGLGSERYEFHNRVLFGHSGGGFHHSVFMYLPHDEVSLAVLTNQATSHILDIASELINEFLNYE